MNSVLCWLMLVALVIRPNRAGLIYACIAIGFNIVWSDAEPYEYFTLAVLADLMCMMVLALFNITRKILYLMLICLVSILLNFFGFIMWYTYQSSEWYVWMFAVVYTIAICIILRKDDRHVGGRDARLYFRRIVHNSDADTSRGNFAKGDTTI